MSDARADLPQTLRYWPVRDGETKLAVVMTRAADEIDRLRALLTQAREDRDSAIGRIGELEDECERYATELGYKNAEVRRLRALLTAEPDDEEVEAAWENFWTAYPCTVADMRRAVDAAIVVRARKMRGDTDE